MPTETEQKIDEDLILAFARLHRLALGVACGTVSGVLVFLATVVGVIQGHSAASGLTLLAQFFPRYSVTISGAFVGLAWGFTIGYCLGWGFALLRNLVVWIWLMVIRSEAEMEQYADLLDHL